MNFFSLFLIACAISLSYAQVANAGANGKQLKSAKQKLGYALGMDIGVSLKNMSQTLDIEALLQGINDEYTGKKLLLGSAEATRIKHEFSNARHQAREAKKTRRDQGNMKKNLAFLAKNKQKNGVIVTSSGLQYEILKKGKGKPGKEKWLRINYRAYLIDGEEVFNNLKSRDKSKIEISKQIKGLQEGLALMPPGSKYRFYIHPRLAYGGLGHGRHIKPYDVLIFEVERLDTKQ